MGHWLVLVDEEVVGKWLLVSPTEPHNCHTHHPDPVLATAIQLV